MRARSVVFALASASLVIACSKKQDAAPVPPAPAPSAPVVAEAPSVAASGPAVDAGPPSPAIPAADVIAHCPSSVTGATTTIEDATGGVVVTVVAKGAAATAEIRSRAAFLAQAAKTGMPYRGGDRCPVVVSGATLVLSDVPGGSKIGVTASDGSQQQQSWIQWESRDRLAQTTATDTSKMADCPSAVLGAQTVVTKTNGAVEVKVVAKDPSDTKAAGMIRDRAKYVVAVAQVVTDAPKHEGAGDASGSMLGCPIVFNETKVDAKDTSGGTLFTLTPKDAKKLDALSKELHERAAKFAASP